MRRTRNIIVSATLAATAFAAVPFAYSQSSSPPAPPPSQTPPLSPSTLPPAPPPPSTAATPAPARADVVDVSVFYDELAPYGDWIKIDRYGWGWHPHGVSVSWRPYTTGHWVYTAEFGWMWQADETWGWAAFHYGRWCWEDDYGWCWLPGKVWGPAWVGWRTGHGYIGWCALPPEVEWREGVGLAFGSASLDIEIGRPRWCFVEDRYIGEPGLRDRIVVAARNGTLIERTHESTRFKEVNGRIVNESFSVKHIERVTGHDVVRTRIREAESVKEYKEIKPSGNEVTVFRKHIAETEVKRNPETGRVVKEDISKDELIKRQAKDAADLKERHEMETKTLTEHQDREVKNPPEGTTIETLRTQHETERRTLEEQHRKDIEVQQRWHERERTHHR